MAAVNAGDVGKLQNLQDKSAFFQVQKQAAQVLEFFRELRWAQGSASTSCSNTQMTNCSDQ